MAGLGFKDFQVGEVLTSSDVDGYLMQQAVMRFADSGARGSALGTAPGTAVALAEGMLSYLSDVNQVQVYDGTGWDALVAGIGSNVVQTTKTSAFTTTSSSFVDITGLSVTITPETATSKILVVGMLSANARSASGTLALKLVRDSTDVLLGDAAGSRTRSTVSLGEGSSLSAGVSMLYLDSPATTSAVTYKVQMAVNSGTGALNTSVDDADLSTRYRTASTLLVVEVAA